MGPVPDIRYLVEKDTHRNQLACKIESRTVRAAESNFRPHVQVIWHAVYKWRIQWRGRATVRTVVFPRKCRHSSVGRAADL